MMMLMTVEVDVENASHARTLGEDAGFTVRRITRPSGRTTTTAPTDSVRASAVIDRPADLDKYENKAYLRGYATGCLTHVRKHGIPRGDDLSAATREAEWERHPAAHKKGMAELAAYRLRWGGTE